jgi:hypothetical protein
MDPNMIGWQDAVAVGEQQVRGRGGCDSFVPTSCQPESMVIVGGERQPKGHPAGGIDDQTVGFVSRTVVGDDHFKSAVHATLSLD